MKNYRRNYKLQASSHSLSETSNRFAEETSSNISHSNYGSSHGSHLADESGEDDTEYYQDGHLSPGSNRHILNLPRPPNKVQYQRSLQFESRSPDAKISNYKFLNNQHGNCVSSSSAKSALDNHNSSFDGTISQLSSHRDSQDASVDEGDSYFSSNGNISENTSTLSSTPSRQKCWKDHINFPFRQTLSMFEKLWRSDYVFLYMTITICTFFGLVIMVFALKKKGQTHYPEQIKNVTIANSFTPSLSPSIKVSSIPTIAQQTEISSTPTKTLHPKHSISPTAMMSFRPSFSPTWNATSIPSQKPTQIPSMSPSTTTNPSSEPTFDPTSVPTIVPSISSKPTISLNPSAGPTEKQCTCAPLTYHFKIDLQKSCQITLTENSGIKGTPSCKYDSKRNHSSFLPIVVTEVFVTELDSNLVGIRDYRNNATLLDGDIITFESITASGQITGGLQGSFKALNAEGEFSLHFLLLFSNTCEILPFNIGDSIGFLVFTKISQPRPETCYYVVTNFPSFSPTSSPTEDFSSQPSREPSFLPSPNPSEHPSKQPSNQPSHQPSELPSQAPTLTPSTEPSFKPTYHPSVVPTETLSNLPSLSPTKSLQWDNFGSTINGQSVNIELGKNVALSKDGKTLAISLHEESSIDVYDRKNEVWVKRSTPVIGPKNTGFGSVISISNNGLIVAGGTYTWDNSRGFVQVWEWNGWYWARLGETMIGNRQGDHFGYSIVLSGDGMDIIIGSRDHDSNESRGSARIMRYDGEDWIQRGSRITGDYAGDLLASRVDSISITDDGSLIAVGAYGGNLVRIFKWIDTDWVQYGSDIYRSEDIYFGASVELSSGMGGNLVLAIGAPKEQPNGSVHFYEWTGQDWSERQDSVSIESSIFIGYSIALSGDGSTILCATDSAVYVFDWNGEKWYQRGSVLEVGGDPYGRTAKMEISVDLSGDGNTVIVGLPYDDDGSLHGENRGQVRSFVWRRPT